MKWKTVKIGNVCQIISGTTPSTNVAEYWGGEFNWIAPAEIEEDSKFVVNTKKTITKKAVNETSMRLLPVGTVLLSSRAPIGKVAITATEMYCNQGFKNLICSDEVHNEFLFWFLKGKKEFLNSLGRGATFKEISKSIVASVEIPLPPLAEQRRIAAIMDKADAIRRKRQQSLELADSLLKSVFLDMFGDPVTNPKGWKKLPLGCIGELNRGVSKHRPRNDPKLLNGQHPLVQTGEVANSSLYITEYTQTYSDIGLKQSKIWTKNTLCITIAANIAKTAILGFDACFPDSVVGFLPNEKTNTFFVHYWFSFFQKILESEAPESAQKNINLKILNELQVINPPVALQQSFFDVVQRVESQKARLRTSLDEAENSFKSLQQSFFG